MSSPPGTSDDRTAVDVSIVVPSYQRRDALQRLLAAIDEFIEPSDSTEVVVVLDGSTDGSAELLETTHLGVPLRWTAQPNAGRSAARNAGLRLAKGRVCLLVDDDMTLSRAAFKAHVDFHQTADQPGVLVGPQWEADDTGPMRRFLELRSERLTKTGRITDPFDFWTGIVSAHRQTLIDVGGFSERFVGWGEEDVELGFRLLDADIPIHFDVAAGGDHWRHRLPHDQISEELERGRNLVLLCELHPGATDRIVPSSELIASFHRRGLRSVHCYQAIARTARLMLKSERIRESGQRPRIANIGLSAARLAGLLEAGASERLQRRFTVGHRAFRSVDSEAAAVAPPLPTTFESRRAEYETTGLLGTAIPLDDGDLVERLRDDGSWFEEAVADMNGAGIHRVPYRFTDAIRSLVCDPNLVATVENILGDDRWVAWGPNIQSGTPNAAYEWHNDIESAFWPTITVVVGLDGCDPDNATRYIPGSHQFDVHPGVVDDQTDDELVLATARYLDPRCNRIVRSEGFTNGYCTVFDAKGWHCGDTDASVGRQALFLHYQRADDPRIPAMSDFTMGTWFNTPAPFMANPALGDNFEHSMYPLPPTPLTRTDRLRSSLARLLPR